jgi:hypothetical protein
MNIDKTIIIPTRNNEDCIATTLQKIKEYTDNHPSVRQIIITDNASNDDTLPAILHFIHSNKDSRFLLITQPRTSLTKKTLLVAIEQSQTQATIILEVQGYTRLHQIKHQCDLLTKADLVLPSRLHKNSLTNYQPTTLDKIKSLFDNKKYKDINNINKAFRTKIIYEALKKSKEENDYWQEIIETNPKMKVTETRTHYIIQ